MGDHCPTSDAIGQNSSRSSEFRHNGVPRTLGRLHPAKKYIGSAAQAGRFFTYFLPVLALFLYVSISFVGHRIRGSEPRGGSRLLLREPPVSSNREGITNPPQLGLQHIADLHTENSSVTNQHLTPVSSAFAKIAPVTPPLPFVLESKLGAERGVREIFECNRSHWRTDYCVVRGDILVFSKKNHILLQTNDVATPVKVEKVRPYTRKWDDGITAKIWEFTIESVRKPGVGNEGEGDGTGGAVEKQIEGVEGGVGTGTEGGVSGGGGVREEQKSRRKLLAIPETIISQVGGEQAVGSSEEGVSVSGGAEGEKAEQSDGGGGGGGERFTDKYDAMLEEARQLTHPLRDAEGNDVNTEGHWTLIPEGGSGGDRGDASGPIRCNVTHNVTGVVFSTGGYNGNVYHELADGLVPLFITLQEYGGEVVILIAEWHFSWFDRFGSVFHHLTNYPPVLLGLKDEIHCFPQLVVGQVAHAEYIVDPDEMRGGASIADFQKLLRKAFKSDPPSHLTAFPPLEPSAPTLPPLTDCDPLLVILVRSGCRALLNMERVVTWAQESGFAVRLLRIGHDTALRDVWAIMQEADVMLGVHGAALTHWLFMRPKTVFIQIVPVALWWPAKIYYGDPATKLPLQYVEYHVNATESSLITKYPADHKVFTDTQSYWDQGYGVVKELYMDNQDVTWQKQNAVRVLAHARQIWMHARFELEESPRDRRCRGMAR